MGVNQDEHRQWLRETAKGDRSAFERLYRAYQRRIFGYLYRMVGSVEHAEELTTDVMVEVWRGAARFKGESQVSTWMFGIARFKALSFLRRVQSESVGVEEANEVPDPNELPDEMLVKQGMAVRIKDALGRLSQEHREVMELTFFEGFSYPEIAKLLDCPVNTVKTRMFYARKQLRALLGAEVAR
jgi:RNA polymerase sigma-70 factor (ECF subfamily)